jgi:hypothetical protein
MGCISSCNNKGHLKVPASDLILDNVLPINLQPSETQIPTNDILIDEQKLDSVSAKPYLNAKLSADKKSIILTENGAELPPLLYLKLLLFNIILHFLYSFLFFSFLRSLHRPNNNNSRRNLSYAALALVALTAFAGSVFAAEATAESTAASGGTPPADAAASAPPYPPACLPPHTQGRLLASDEALSAAAEANRTWEKASAAWTAREAAIAAARAVAEDALSDATRQLEALRENAERALSAYADTIVEVATPSIESEALKVGRPVWKDLVIGAMSAVTYSVLLLVAAYLIKVFGNDFADALQGVTGIGK